MAADEAGWWLERVGGEGAGQRLELRPGAQVTFGRGLGVTHRLLAKTCPLMISRNHCSFCLTPEGVCTVTDNQSLNGVWVNGMRVEPQQPRVLCEGDLVQLGVPAAQEKDAEFVYRVVRWRAPPARESGTKRRLGSEDSEQQGAAGKLRRLGEGHQWAAWPEAANGQRRGQTAQHPEPGTSRQPSGRDLWHTHRAGGQDQGSAHRDPDRGLPTAHRDPDQGLLMDQGLTHRDPDRGLPTTHRDPDQGLLMDQGLTHRDPDRGLPTTHRDPDQGLLTAHGDPDRRLPTTQGDRNQELPTDQAPAQGDPDRGLPTTHRDPDRGLPTTHRDPDQGLLMDQGPAHRDPDQGLPTGQTPAQGDTDRGLPTTHRDWDHGDRTEEDWPQVGEDVPSAESQLTEVLETELQCVICSEHFIEAVTLGCSHSFCRLCIGQWRGRSGECPICRQPIQWQTRSVVLDSCIERMVSRLGEAVRRQREQLVRARRELLADRGCGAGSDPGGGTPTPSLSSPPSLVPEGPEPGTAGSRDHQLHP